MTVNHGCWRTHMQAVQMIHSRRWAGWGPEAEIILVHPLGFHFPFHFDIILKMFKCPIAVSALVPLCKRDPQPYLFFPSEIRETDIVSTDDFIYVSSCALCHSLTSLWLGIEHFIATHRSQEYVCMKIEGTGKHYVKWNKPGSESHIIGYLTWGTGINMYLPMCVYSVHERRGRLRWERDQKEGPKEGSSLGVV